MPKNWTQSVQRKKLGPVGKQARFSGNIRVDGNEIVGYSKFGNQKDLPVQKKRTLWGFYPRSGGENGSRTKFRNSVQKPGLHDDGEYMATSRNRTLEKKMEAWHFDQSREFGFYRSPLNEPGRDAFNKMWRENSYRSRG